MLKNKPVKAGERDEPTERAMAVTPEAADLSSGATESDRTVWFEVDRRSECRKQWCFQVEIMEALQRSCR